MKTLKVNLVSDMVCIDNEDVSFARIPNMYTEDRAGIALQINPGVNRQVCEKMCIKIAEAVTEFEKS